ncbi:MAG: ParB N-terminal domain-containing protein, partial [Anaerolineae bacterium]|nr:ParB N-terminal domain-containing protein [Anaerolineae bacterium]
MEESSLLDHYESQEKWARARRGALVQRVVGTFKKGSVDLIPFEEVRTRLHLTQKYCRGLEDIELAHIRGSVGRYRDFTSAFLPRRDHLRQRWERVNTMVSSQDMPPIEVYQVGEAYFVLDGNHRVSAARQEGMKTIPAYVCEFVTPVGLSAEADCDEVITKS